MQIFVANKQVDNNFSPPTQSSCEGAEERDSAMGTPNLSGFYYRMTDLVASQLYHLSNIVMAKSAIRGSNVEGY